jgi:hypothetical protein
MVYCTQCHHYLAADATHCPSCGRAIAAAATGVTQRLQPPLSPTCLRCGSEMEQGFVIDMRQPGHDTIEQWIEGLPKYNKWLGGLNTSDKRVLPIRTYRCVRCGYLESYALPEDLA